MQGFEAFLIRLSASRYNRIKPVQFTFQVLVDKQQRLKRSTNVSVA